MTIRVLRIFSASNFALSDAENNTLGQLYRGSTAGIPFIRRIGFARNHMSKVFGKQYTLLFYLHNQLRQLQEPFLTIANLSEFHFRCRKLILLVQMKKVILMSKGISTIRWKSWRWNGLGLIFTMRDIYINSNVGSFTKFIISNKFTELKGMVHPIVHLSNVHKDRHNQMKISITCVMERTRFSL